MKPLDFDDLIKRVTLDKVQKHVPDAAARKGRQVIQRPIHNVIESVEPGTEAALFAACTSPNLQRRREIVKVLLPQAQHRRRNGPTFDQLKKELDDLSGCVVDDENWSPSEVAEELQDAIRLETLNAKFKRCRASQAAGSHQPESCAYCCSVKQVGTNR